MDPIHRLVMKMNRMYLAQLHVSAHLLRYAWGPWAQYICHSLNQVVMLQLHVVLIIEVLEELLMTRT